MGVLKVIADGRMQSLGVLYMAYACRSLTWIFHTYTSLLLSEWTIDIRPLFPTFPVAYD